MCWGCNLYVYLEQVPLPNQARKCSVSALVFVLRHQFRWRPFSCLTCANHYCYHRYIQYKIDCTIRLSLWLFSNKPPSRTAILLPLFVVFYFVKPVSASAVICAVGTFFINSGMSYNLVRPKPRRQIFCLNHFLRERSPCSSICWSTGGLAGASCKACPAGSYSTVSGLSLSSSNVWILAKSLQRIRRHDLVVSNLPKCNPGREANLTRNVFGEINCTACYAWSCSKAKNKI